jgi:hypothetical protein
MKAEWRKTSFVDHGAELKNESTTGGRLAGFRFILAARILIIKI